jgi:hypothetical protein
MIVKYSLGEAASVKIPGTNKKDPVIHGHGISQKTGEGKGRSEEAGSSGVAGVAGVQECRGSGVQGFRSAGVQELQELQEEVRVQEAFGTNSPGPSLHRPPVLEPLPRS